MGIWERGGREEEEAGAVSICPPRREDRLLRTFRRFAACLCSTARWRKRIVPFAVSHLQCGGGDFFGGRVRGCAVSSWLTNFPNPSSPLVGGAHFRGAFL